MRLLSCFLLVWTLAAAELKVISDDGGWCWFQDERTLVHNGRIIAGSVAAGVHSAERTGDVEVAVFDLQTGQSSVHTLHRGQTPQERRRWYDDHNSPAFLIRPDGRLLAMYSQHGPQEKIYYRISTRPNDAASWGEERVFVPSPGSRVTYTNLHLLRRENNGKGRIYNFFRGLQNSSKPSWAWSDDFGETWTAGGIVIHVPTQFRHRPYVKYASDGEETVHMLYTEGHPRDYDNSIYHVFYRRGNIHRSDGTVIRSLAEGLHSPEEGTAVFRGDADRVAWTSDLHLDKGGRPYGVFSVQVGGRGLPPKQHGDDHRYYYARWTGKKWMAQEIAFAGGKLYAGEDDYTGNIAADPQDPDTVYISTNADPVSGTPLRSEADGKRHWEIFRGTQRDGRWSWNAVTNNSTADNLRPIIPILKSERRVVLWLQGTLTTYTNYRLKVVALIEKP